MIFSFVGRSETGISEIDAFPKAMAERVTSLVETLACGQIHPPSGTIMAVRVAEEHLHIPYRVYYDTQQLSKAVDRPGDATLIALCLGTRHHDGFLREKCLRRLLESDAHWVAPFVLQLLGEYVIEIVRPIHEHFVAGVEEKYRVFYRQNGGYCQSLERRAISYWSEYYRSRFTRYEDYPAVRALRLLREAAASVVLT